MGSDHLKTNKKRKEIGREDIKKQLEEKGIKFTKSSEKPVGSPGISRLYNQ